MADITKNSYDETNLIEKVLFQRGRPVIDFELNELQDNIRVKQYRAFFEGVAGQSLNPGSNDDGYKVTGTGASNSVTIGAGTLFVNGLPIRNTSSFSFSGFTTNPGPSARTDLVYASVVETEIADPNAVPELGETSRRTQLQVTLNVAEGTTVPASSGLEIWEGGTHNFEIASINRPSGQAAINANDVTDSRKRLPAFVLAQITKQYGTAGSPNILGNWRVTVGDGVNSFGDINGANAINDALAIIWGLGDTAHIFIKNGSYNWDAATYGPQVATTSRLVLEGESRQAIVTMTSQLTNIAHIQFKSLELRGATNADKPLALTGGLTSLIVDDCYFNGISFDITNDTSVVESNTPNIHVRNSSLIHDNDLDNVGSLFRVNFTDSDVTFKKIVVENTYIKRSNVAAFSTTVLGFYDSTGTALGFLEYVEFNNCQFDLGTSNDLDFGLNSGVIGNTRDFGLAQPFPAYRIGTVRFEKCRVRANTVGGSISTLIYLTTDDTPANSALIDHLIIEGGSWVCPDTSTTYTPFYISKTNWAAGSMRSPVRQLDIHNVEFGFENYAGGAVSPVFYGTYSTEITNQPSAGDKSAFFAEALLLNVSNVYFKNMTRASNEGDFGFAAVQSNIDGVKVIRPYITGGGGLVPNSRGFFTRSSTSWVDHKHYIKNIVISKTEPVDEQLVSTDRGVIEFDVDNATFDTCLVDRAGNNVTHRNVGIFDRNNSFNIIIKNCSVIDCYRGIHIINTLGGIGLSDWELSGNKIISSVSVGIWVDADIISSILIQGNNIRNNGDIGLVVSHDNNQAFFTIANNRVADNNSLTTDPQILVANRALGQLVDTAYGIITANDCSSNDSPGDFGTIQVRATATYETIGISVTGGLQTVPISLASAGTTGTRMLFNQALWSKA